MFKKNRIGMVVFSKGRLKYFTASNFPRDIKVLTDLVSGITDLGHPAMVNMNQYASTVQINFLRLQSSKIVH